MIEMTIEQRERLARRRSSFPEFLKECFPILGEFLSHLGIEVDDEISRHIDQFVKPVNDWMRTASIPLDERNRFIVRIGYFIGEVFRQKYRGEWMIDEDHLSPYFSHYVVGRFYLLPNESIEVSPFANANNYVDEGVGRDLNAMLARIEEGLKSLVRS